MVNHGEHPQERDVDTAAAHDLGKPYGLPAVQPESALLRGRYEHLQAAVDSMDSNLCLLDETGLILWVNAAWRRFAAANGGDASRCNEGGDYFSWRHPDAGDQPADPQAFGSGLLDVLAGRREQFAAEYACQTPTGPRWFYARARGHQLAGCRRTIVAHEDITARKEVEIERAAALRHRLERQKVEAIGSLANGIAHDFNNILTAILGNLDLARMQTPPDAPVRELLDEIGKAGERARGLVRQILSFRPGRAQERQLVSLAPLIEEAADMLRATAPKQLSIELRLDPIPPLRIDPTQIHQVLLNLFTNAAYAMNASAGRLQVELAVVDIDAAAAVGPGCRTGRYARIRVSDNGVGMSADLLPRIFDPFFTTKPAGKGNGIGLPVAQAIVHNHGGAITAHSEIGAGATFEVYLPYHDGAAPPSRP
jgi:signal transduction histidine kinase